MQLPTEFYYFTSNTWFHQFFSIVSLNSCLSSAIFIASVCCTQKSYIRFFKKTCFCNFHARFNPVCPPNVGNKLSGFSISIIFFKNIYCQWFYINFICYICICHYCRWILFTSTTSICSSFNALHA